MTHKTILEDLLALEAEVNAKVEAVEGRAVQIWWEFQGYRAILKDAIGRIRHHRARVEKAYKQGDTQNANQSGNR